MGRRKCLIKTWAFGKSRIMFRGLRTMRPIALNVIIMSKKSEKKRKWKCDFKFFLDLLSEWLRIGLSSRSAIAIESCRLIIDWRHLKVQLFRWRVPAVLIWLWFSFDYTWSFYLLIIITYCGCSFQIASFTLNVMAVPVSPWAIL